MLPIPIQVFFNTYLQKCGDCILKNMGTVSTKLWIALSTKMMNRIIQDIILRYE